MSAEFRCRTQVKALEAAGTLPWDFTLMNELRCGPSWYPNGMAARRINSAEYDRIAGCRGEASGGLAQIQ